MNETQEKKMRVLEWVFSHKYPATLKEKVEAAKEIYKFVFGDEAQAVPDETITCKGSDTRIDYGKPISKTLMHAINFKMPTESLSPAAYNTDGSIKTVCEVEGYHCTVCGNIFYVDSEKKSKEYYCPACGK